MARAACVGAALASACAPIDRARQCEAFAEAVNPALAKIEAQTKSLGRVPSGADAGRTALAQIQHLVEIAESYEALSKTMEALEPTDTKLKPVAKDMAKLYGKTAKTARSIARNVEKSQLKALGGASRRLERQKREQDTLVKRAKRICKTK